MFLYQSVGTEDRFTLNGSFELKQSPKNIIENMLSSIAGNLIYSNGQFKLRPATYMKHQQLH